MASQASGDGSCLTPATVHDLSNLTDETSQKLARLIWDNHTNFAVLREPRLLFHNHLPHALGSSYLLGATSQKLDQIYSAEALELKAVNDGLIQDGVTESNWRDLLGSKPHTVAFTAFFDSVVEDNHGDWKSVVESYLFSGDEPLINGFSGGLGHPFIHLAYAYEFNSKEVATEALSMGCTEYDRIHAYIDRYPVDNATYKTTRLEDILHRIRQDNRLDNLFEEPGFANIEVVLKKREMEILEHWNAWDINNPSSQLKDCMITASLLSISTGNSHGEFDFYLAHTLTVGHALRILLPAFPLAWHAPILRQYGLFIILVYIAQLRPAFSVQDIASWTLRSSSWEVIAQQSQDNEFSIDVHFPKVVRALKEAEMTWGLENEHYIKAAEKFISEFRNWAGFGLGVEAIP